MHLVLASLLAQSLPPPAVLTDWLLIAVWIVGFVGALVAIAVGLKMLLAKPALPLPQPVVVRSEDRWTPLTTHEQLALRVQEVDQRMEERFREAAIASAASRAKLYDLIRDQGQQLAAVGNEAERTRADVGNLDAKIDRILERLPRRA